MAVAGCVCCTTGGLLRANALRNPLLRLLRRLGLGLLTRIPAVRQAFVSSVTEDSVAYTTSSLAKPAVGANPGPAGCAGTAFPDVSITVGGAMRPATDLLRGGDGCFGTLVLLQPPAGAVVGQAGSADDADAGSSKATAWPGSWGHWPLHLVSVARGLGVASGRAGGAVDAWGLLAKHVGGADGVLVRPDGIIAAAGGPQDVQAWLKAHT